VKYRQAGSEERRNRKAEAAWGSF